METDIKILGQEMSARGVRPSPVRLLVFRTLRQSPQPMSGQEIENELGTVDRSSITRTIAVFSKAGLIHSIVDGSGSVKYEACHSLDPESDTDEHLHFRCEVCGRTICLTDIPVPSIVLPEGFTAKKYNFVIVGACDDCNTSKSQTLNDKR